jgi:ubiquinone biosynthesis protein
MTRTARTARAARAARVPLRRDAAAQGRRLEIERCLAEHGLRTGPRRFARRTATAGEEFVERLAAALERLGPVFTAFGRYLAARADLFPAADCLRLAALPDETAPAPAAAMLALIGEQLGRPPADLFASFEETACESSLLFQAHHARLPGGEEVVVRAVRPGLKEQMALDLGCFDLLAGLPGLEAGEGPSTADLAEAAGDFEQALARSVDLTSQAEGLEAVSADVAAAGGITLVAAPGVVRALTAPGVIVCQRLAGTTPASVLRADGPGGEPPDAGARHGWAHRLAVAWMEQALRGSVFPIEPVPGNVLLLDDGRLAFVGGSFARATTALQQNVWAYLAAAGHDPDAACSSLLREMKRRGPGSEEKLRLRLRQAIPFRDGAWSAAGDSLAELLFVQWRAARASGFEPGTRMSPFCRGLCSMATTVRLLDRDCDAVREGFAAVRVRASVEPLREMLDPRQLRGELARYAVLLAQMPHDLDRALTLAAEPREPPGSPGPEAAGGRGQERAVLLGALVMALAALSLVARQLTAAGWKGIEPAAAIVALVLGGLILRAVGRRG